MGPNLGIEGISAVTCYGFGLGDIGFLNQSMSWPTSFSRIAIWAASVCDTVISPRSGSSRFHILGWTQLDFSVSVSGSALGHHA